MTESLYRFEAECDGEHTDLGLFSALYNVGMPDPKPRLIEGMFHHLTSPDIEEPVSFWFTKEGILQFADAIAYTIESMQPYRWGLLMAKVRYDTESPHILYKDDYQVGIAYECRPDEPEDWRPVKSKELDKLTQKISQERR